MVLLVHARRDQGLESVLFALGQFVPLRLQVRLQFLTISRGHSFELPHLVEPALTILLWSSLSLFSLVEEDRLRLRRQKSPQPASATPACEISVLIARIVGDHLCVDGGRDGGGKASRNSKR